MLRISNLGLGLGFFSCAWLGFGDKVLRSCAGKSCGVGVGFRPEGLSLWVFRRALGLGFGSV